MTYNFLPLLRLPRYVRTYVAYISKKEDLLLVSLLCTLNSITYLHTCLPRYVGPAIYWRLDTVVDPKLPSPLLSSTTQP